MKLAPALAVEHAVHSSVGRRAAAAARAYEVLRFTIGAAVLMPSLVVSLLLLSLQIDQALGEAKGDAARTLVNEYAFDSSDGGSGSTPVADCPRFPRFPSSPPSTAAATPIRGIPGGRRSQLAPHPSSSSYLVVRSAGEDRVCGTRDGMHRSD